MSRERGATIECDHCDATLTTGQIAVRLIRHYAKTQGWIRGLLKRSTGSAETGTGERANGKHDICPACAPAEKRRAAEREEAARARKAEGSARKRMTPEELREHKNKKARERRAARRAAEKQAA
ncbi:MAG TPA: hypothetical protein VFT22_07150 [Kofleriaceae bacterium]|nr:hypothetical protein [Kofleriaceae bacterium]